MKTLCSLMLLSLVLPCCTSARELPVSPGLDDQEMGIRNLTERAQIEVEAQIIEIVTKEDGEFERLLSLPEQGGSFPLVLDGEEYETLLSKATDAAGASVVSRPKIAVRDGARGEVVNLTTVPFFGTDGQVAHYTVGFEFSFRPRVLSAQTLALTMDMEWSKRVGQSIVTTPDGTEVPIPEISQRRERTRVSVEKGQGVVLGGLVVMRGPGEDAEPEYTHVLYFARPRVLPAGEAGGF